MYLKKPLGGAGTLKIKGSFWSFSLRGNEDGIRKREDGEALFPPCMVDRKYRNKIIHPFTSSTFTSRIKTTQRKNLLISVP